MLLEKNFIASAVGLRTISMTFNVENATEDENGKKYIAAGTYYTNEAGSSEGESTGATRKGIALNDVYFHDGETEVVAPLIVAGHILKDRLPVEITDEQVMDLAAQGLFFEVSAPTTVMADTIVVDEEGGE